MSAPASGRARRDAAPPGRSDRQLRFDEALVAHPDPEVRKLAAFFLDHPAWIEAARTVTDGSTSRVFFSHVPGEFRLLRRRGKSLLLAGQATDPDFAFRFTPQAIDRITATDGDIGDFAVALFRAIADRDPNQQVGFRILVPFRRLLRRGYVALLLRGGAKVIRYGAQHGIATIGELRRFLSQTRVSDPRWKDL